MRLFVDTADIREAETWFASGFVSGMTTNPTLMARVGARGATLATALCALATPHPVSVQAMGPSCDAFVAQGRALATLAPNLVVKLPLTSAGLRACAVLTHEGVATNMTLCFSLSQGLLAARSGATWVSPFMGRLDDGTDTSVRTSAGTGVHTGTDTGTSAGVGVGAGARLVGDLVHAFGHFGLKTKVLAASARDASHVEDAIRAGAHALTAPPALLRALAEHPLTDAGLARFNADADAQDES